MDQLSKDWTDDELLSEIRRRERRAGSGDRSRAAAPPVGRARDLADVPTGELVRAAKGRQRAIYGSDNRQDIYQVTKPAVRRSADAVVALVKRSDLSENADGSFDLLTESYKEAYDLCSSEPFVSQPTGCFCSGFLVGPDVIATAGHCVKNAADRTHRFATTPRRLSSRPISTRMAATPARPYSTRRTTGWKASLSAARRTSSATARATYRWSARVLDAAVKT